MNRDDDRQLWDLLGKSEKIEVSPFFARNVLRGVRELPTGSFSWLRLPALKRVISLGGAAAVVIVSLTFVRLPHGNRAPVRADEVASTLDDQDMDLIADLDDSSPADDGALWDDDTATL